MRLSISEIDEKGVPIHGVDMEIDEADLELPGDQLWNEYFEPAIANIINTRKEKLNG